MEKTCKVCGETKEAIKGLWVIKHGQQTGRVCLKCRGIKRNAVNATPEGRAQYTALNHKVRATLEGRSRHNEAAKLYCRKIRATPEGRAEHNEACRKTRATPEGRAKHTAATIAWRTANPAKTNALGARRKASKLMRTPAWADHSKIAWFYMQAAELTATTGVLYAVDHIVPLRGINVSGLHVHNNLQVIPQSENRSKGNKWQPK